MHLARECVDFYRDLLTLSARVCNQYITYKTVHYLANFALCRLVSYRIFQYSARENYGKRETKQSPMLRPR